MKEDIVKRLRAPSGFMTTWTHMGLHGEAAAEIERLRARVEGFEKALTEIAEYCCDADPTVGTIEYAVLRALGRVYP